ncbi:MAG TPA: nitroreductase family protein [Caulobacteraceae bacterium]|nr:nitroreductase family protein [Caulobacteraceae bacterium]
MDAVDAIYGRRSIRDYAVAAPPREEIEALIEAAIQAPNGVNLQPWTFAVICGRPILAEWSRLAKAHILGSGVALPGGLADVLKDEAFDIFYNAPALVVICATNADPMSVKDCCLAAANLMLAAHDRGLGTCWIGFSEGWLASTEGRARLGVPDGCVPVAPIILGRPVSLPPRPGRRPAEIRWIETAPAHA